MHGQGQQKIELGKSFFNEFSVVYNNGNEKFSLYTTTLRDIEHNKVKSFTSLDIETQIKFLEQLENLLK
jgi:hypothetical protein